MPFKTRLGQSFLSCSDELGWPKKSCKVLEIPYATNKNCYHYKLGNNIDSSYTHILNMPFYACLCTHFQVGLGV